MQRPNWLPSYLPELDGLRGLAILWVVLYHCDPLLQGTWLHRVAEWGWAGVDIFFVLSGFLITSNLLGARDKPRYFHNFHARRALRIWPVYILTLAVVYLNAPWFIGPSVLGAIKAAPWLAYIFFVQNLFHLTLPAALGPTWALAVEEQYYFFWAPLVRFLRRPWMLAVFLTCALICSPLLRHLNPVWLWNVPNHTLIKLDGIALGSLLALGLYTLKLSRRVWLWIGLGAFVLGVGAAAAAYGTSLLDTALALGFTGAVLALMTSTTGVPGDRSSSLGWSTGVPGDRSSSPGWSTGARNPVNAVLRRGPLAFYGRISYGLYMIHIVAFVFIGWFDLWMVRYGMAGSLAVVAARFAVSTALAAAMWYGFESQILKLKRHF
jgi:peptidoglycan/LPS O-acetylase OafA/YrhL